MLKHDDPEYMRAARKRSYWKHRDRELARKKEDYQTFTDAGFRFRTVDGKRKWVSIIKEEP